MASNPDLATKVYLFGQEAKKRNSFIGTRIMNCVPSLLEYHGQLEGLIEPEVAQIKGIRTVAQYITRVMQGEAYETIMRDIPLLQKTARRSYPTERSSQAEGGNSWDNSVRTHEDKE